VVVIPFSIEVPKEAEDDTLVRGKTASVDKRTDDLSSFVLATSVVELVLPQTSVSSVSSPNTPQDVEGIEHVCYNSGRCERISCIDRFIQTLKVQS